MASFATPIPVEDLRVEVIYADRLGNAIAQFLKSNSHSGVSLVAIDVVVMGNYEKVIVYYVKKEPDQL
jgi:hypothetical protein